MMARSCVAIACTLIVFLPEAIAQDPHKSQSDALSGFLTLLEGNSQTNIVPSEKLARYIAGVCYGSTQHVDVEKRLAEALTTRGALRGIRSAEWTTQATLAGLQSPKRTSLTLEIDRNALLRDAAIVVDAFGGTKGLFDEVLHGIARDPNGPQIDVKKQIVDRLGNKCVIVNDRTTDEYQWLIAFRVEDHAEIGRAMNLAMRSDPSAILEDENYYVTNDYAVCLTRDWLVIGKNSLVRNVIQTVN